MRDYDSNKPLISIHIPKCGGISFTRILEGWFKERLVLHYFDEKNNRMPIKHRLNPGSGVCIHGHFNMKRGFGITDYYSEVDQFITILRDPFEILLSNYFYVKRLGVEAYRDGLRYDLGDFSDYLKKHGSFMFLHMPCEITMDNFKEIFEKYFVYIGVLEDIQVSVDCLAKKLGFPVTIITHENISERSIEITEQMREEFKERYPLEHAVYNYALSTYKNV